MSVEPNEPQQVPRPALLLTARLLTIGALLVTGYLSWVSLRDSMMIGCGPVSNCHELLKSQWAYWLGVPVSVPASIIYVTMLVGTFCLTPQTPASRKKVAWILLIFCGFVVVGAVVWFSFLQVTVVRKICPFCMISHGLV
jgi:uncharacterized membrane protein